VAEVGQDLRLGLTGLGVEDDEGLVGGVGPAVEALLDEAPGLLDGQRVARLVGRRRQRLEGGGGDREQQDGEEPVQDSGSGASASW
jgi:hypothetical protein